MIPWGYMQRGTQDDSNVEPTHASLRHARRLSLCILRFGRHRMNGTTPPSQSALLRVRHQQKLPNRSGPRADHVRPAHAFRLDAGRPQPFLRTPFAERFAHISPDGQWVAYESNQSGTSQVYVTAFRNPGHVQQVSATGGVWPAWSPTKRELYYSTDDVQLMLAGYRVDGDTFKPE